MSTSRILEPARTVDPYYHQAQRMAELENRIALLERQGAAESTRFVRKFSAATSGVLVPKMDGESITGLRISAHGYIAGGTNTYLRLKPNGLSSMPTNAIGLLTYIGAGGTYTPTLGGPTYGGALSSSPGIVIMPTHYSVANTVGTCSGVFYTSRLGANFMRAWRGIYTSRDATTDASELSMGDIGVQWNDGTTQVTSLSWALDAGNFTGRFSVEIIP